MTTNNQQEVDIVQEADTVPEVDTAQKVDVNDTNDESKQEQLDSTIYNDDKLYQDIMELIKEKGLNIYETGKKLK